MYSSRVQPAVGAGRVVPNDLEKVANERAVLLLVGRRVSVVAAAYKALMPCLKLSRLGQCTASLEDYGTWGRPNPEHPPRKNREQNAFSIID